ncbi:Vacuolar fusion protein MON1-like protein [Aphelenchoides fujianensis]|nr:Vacuolar fusion protein MON1-like protein [Aphelenchoides fujianensis]
MSASPTAAPETEVSASLAAAAHQIWILSEFGKPIFGSVGNESELAAVFALMAVLVRTYEQWDDTLHTIQMDRLYVHFSYRSPIILCIVAAEPSNLKWHLEVIYNQVLSILSKFQLKKIYVDRGDNFDLRRWLGDIDKRVDVCLKSFELDPVVYLAGFRILPMNETDREFLVSTMAACINARTSTVAFAVLIAHRQLIALVRMKRLNLTSSDFNILANVVECYESLRDVETWVPLCLPHFNKTSFLYAHISYLWETGGPCLIMLSSSRDAFHDLKDIRENIADAIGRYKRVLRLKAAVSQPDFVCCSSPQRPFITPAEQSHLYKGYFKLMDLVRKSKNVDYTKGGESAEEMARRYEQEIERVMQESLASTQRSVRQLDSSEQLGTNAARDLLAQREKLERAERNLDDINHTTQLTQRSLNSLKSVFGGFFKNKFSRAPQKPNQTEVTPSQSSGKLSQTLEQQQAVPPGGNPGQLARLRALGNALGDEVDEQNQMLTRIQGKTERNDSVVRNQDNQMKKLLGYKPAPPEKK